jgi:large subunit ribosomal protein L4
MSVKLNIYNQNAETVGSLEASAKVFATKINTALIHQVMVAQMGNARQVLAHTKDRSEVRGGGKKPWRQKGTGRARVGSSRSPIWIGGGVTFGPTSDRNFKKKINKKMNQQAMCMALTDRVNDSSMVVIDKLNFSEFKTKAVNEAIKKIEDKILKNAKSKRSILVINDNKEEKTKYSIRNLVGIKQINLENINLLDLLKYKNLIITAESVKKLESLYGKAK